MPLMRCVSVVCVCWLAVLLSTVTTTRDGTPRHTPNTSRLLQLPVVTPQERGAYRDALFRMVDRLGGAALAEEPMTGEEGWRITQVWPEVVVRQCEAQDLPLPPLSKWQSLIEADRHALFVLARSSHSQAEFVAAMALFFGG